MAGGRRTKPAASIAATAAATNVTPTAPAAPPRPPAPNPLWPPGLPVQSWQQKDGVSCTAFPIGAAAYWFEWNKTKTDPGTPDFSFLYNNEEFLTSRLATQFVGAERRGATSVVPNEPGFRLRAAARAAAIFGVPFGPGDVSVGGQKWWDVAQPPSYDAYVAARQHRYDFKCLFEQPQIDPNDATLPQRRLAASLNRHDVVRESLVAGTPVAMCYGLYGRFESGSLPPLTQPMPPPLPKNGYHAVLIVGFDDEKQFFTILDSNTSGTVGGTRQLPYSWVDDENATIGFTTLTPTDGRFRGAVALDNLRVTNQGATAAQVTAYAYDGASDYLGHMPLGEAPCVVPAGQSVLVNPVRWLATYRLLVTVTPSGGGVVPVPTLEMFVDDPDGAVASGAEIVIPSDPLGAPQGSFLRADGRTLATVSRTVTPEDPAPTAM